LLESNRPSLFKKRVFWKGVDKSEKGNNPKKKRGPAGWRGRLHEKKKGTSCAWHEGKKRKSEKKKIVGSSREEGDPRSISRLQWFGGEGGGGEKGGRG